MLIFSLAQIIVTFANIDVSEQVVRLVFNIILTVAIIPALIFVISLLGFHTYLTRNNMTTN